MRLVFLAAACAMMALISVQLVQSQSTDEIVFIRDSAGTSADLFRRDLAGTYEIQLTDVLTDYQTRYVHDADCSPDGVSIAYSIGGSISVMDADGENVVEILFGGRYSGMSWSPGSAYLVFDSSRGNTHNDELYTSRPDGSQVTRITTSAALESSPDWSPDATHVVSSYSEAGMHGLKVTSADGATSQTIFETSDYVSSPEWSPDGSRIAFVVGAVAEQFHIYTIRPDGSDLTQITSGSFNDATPVWSPDGTKILFASRRDGNTYQLFTMDSNGSNVQRITSTSNDAKDHFPVCWLRTLPPTADLTGTITLPSRTQGTAAYVVDLSVKLADSGGTLVSEHSPTTDVNGTFTLPDLPQGTYGVWLKHDQSLAVMPSVNLDAPAVSLNFGALKMGDANNSNNVNISDFSILSAAYGKSQGQSGYDARADFNGDNSVGT
ncbi:MAG: PD40 domain-containing protein, partial [Anaerolineae bacterium]|nr:PD40 domain-containing protein [Anaerolineae bacterium]